MRKASFFTVQVKYHLLIEVFSDSHSGGISTGAPDWVLVHPPLLSCELHGSQEGCLIYSYSTRGLQPSKYLLDKIDYILIKICYL